MTPPSPPPRVARAVLAALALLLGPLVAPARALDPGKAITQYVHDVWQAKDGFRQNAVRAIAQTPEGYLWLATQAGLVRFDGLKFTVFDPGNTPGLRGAIILSLLVARDGTLWIGTDGGGLSRYRHGTFTAYTTRDGLAQDFVWSLHEGRDGSIWIGTGGNGVNRWKDGRVQRDRWPVGHVAALLEDRAGRLWIGTTTGLHCLEDGRLRTYTQADGLGDPTVRALREDRDGTLWIGTSGGLLRFRAGRLHAVGAPAGAPGARGPSVRALAEDRHGTLWIGTLDGGLGRLRQQSVVQVRRGTETGPAPGWQGATSEVYRAISERGATPPAGMPGRSNARRTCTTDCSERVETFTSQDGLSDNSVLALFQDREGSLWIGTRNGLNRLRDGPMTTYTTKDGLPTDAVRTLAATPDGAIWIATDGAGVVRLNEGRVTTFGRAQGLSDDHLYAIRAARDGSIWVTAAGQTLSRIRDGRVTSFHTSERLAGLGEDDEGVIVGVSTGGIARFVPEPDGRPGGRLTGFDRVDTRAGASLHVYAMFRDRAGTRWLASNDGLWRRRAADAAWTRFSQRDGLPDNQVYALYEDDEGMLWVATRGGLARLHAGRITAFTPDQGLFDSIVFHVLDDRRGNLWMNASRGIFRVRRADLNAVADGRLARVTPVAYDTTDGMKSAESNAHAQPAAVRAPDGRLWFVTDKGLVVVDPANLPTNALVPSVVVEDVLADGRRMGTRGDVRIAAGTKRLEFHYTALSLLVPQKVRFKYRLDGYDEDWVDGGGQRIATYANLAPGSYRFRVTASNNDGVWNEAGAALHFALAPHFHQTVYFYLIAGLSALALCWGLYRVRMRYIEAQFALVLSERNRLAREFHDTLEAGFVGITLQLDVAAAKLRESPDLASKHLTLARTMVLHSMAEARRSVWDLRSHALQHGDLASALAQVANELNADGSVSTEVRVHGTPTRLPAVAENGVFRIGQEAITNAFKHARAATLVVELSFERDKLRLRVQDDGQGFVAPAPTATKGGFGLLGMRERANKLRAQLTLRTDPGKGTEVVVELPRAAGGWERPVG